MTKGDNGSDSLSSDTVAYLEDVKKGKCRKFVMICKGTSVVSLVVYKKGNVEKRRKEAKESGKGQFYFGVVDGKGVDIRFVLARSDGFETEPVKRTALKSFLEESTDLKLKPTFEIVDTIPLVLDEDDPLVARFLQLEKLAGEVALALPNEAQELTTVCRQAASYLDQEQTDQATSKIDELQALLDRLQPAGASVASTTSTPTPTPPSPQPAPVAPTTTSETEPPPPPPPPPPSLEGRDRFLARLKVLKPQIDQAVIATTATGALVKELAGQAGAQARQQQFVEANALLDQVEEALAQHAAATANTTTATESGSEPGAAFMARLKSLMPLINQAKAGTAASDKEISLKASEAAALARSRDFSNANLCLDRIEALARSSSAQADFTARFKTIKPNLDQVLTGGPPLSDQAKPLAVEAATLARSQNFDAALTVLARLEELLAGKPSERKLGPKVALQQSLLQWESARKRIDSQLEQLESEILELFESDTRLADVQAHIHRLDDVLADYADDLRDHLDNAYQAEEAERPPHVASALKVLNEYRQYLSTDPFIKEVASNLLMPIDIDGILGQALDTIAKRLSV